MLDANQVSILRNCMSVSVSVTPLTVRMAASAFSSRSSCVASGISKGSFSSGACQLSMNAASSTILTSPRFARAEALAMATAFAAQRATPSRVNWSVDANPHAPLASTRTPMPMDSDSASVPTCPFLVVRSRWRRCMTRASVYFAPRSLAVSRTTAVRSHIGSDLPFLDQVTRARERESFYLSARWSTKNGDRGRVKCTGGQPSAPQGRGRILPVTRGRTRNAAGQGRETQGSRVARDQLWLYTNRLANGADGAAAKVGERADFLSTRTVRGLSGRTSERTRYLPARMRGTVPAQA